MKVTVERKVYWPRLELCKKLGLDPKKVSSVESDGFGVEVKMCKVQYEQE